MSLPRFHEGNIDSLLDGEVFHLKRTFENYYLPKKANMLREGGPQIMNQDWPKPTIPWEWVMPFSLARISLGDTDVTQPSQIWIVVLEKTLESPLSARRTNQSILKDINSEYSLEGLMLNLKLQYFSHLMQRADSLEKTLMLGKIKGKGRRGRQRMRWLDGTPD